MNEPYTLLKQRVDERVSLREALLFFLGAIAVAAIYMGVVFFYAALGAVMGV